MYNNVEYNDDTNEYHLVQKKNTIESLEEPYSSEVISYVFGIFESKGKTMKKGKKATKTRTRKLTIESSSSEENESSSNLPIIGPDGTITWKDENYKQAWNKLSSKHKELLSRNRDWLQDSMNSYAINNKDRKMLKFIYPRNVIFPPNRLEDGTYDFGNDLYNEVSNINKGLINEYQKDLSKIGEPIVDASGKPTGNNPITQELANKWFKGSVEEKVYGYLYPIRSQLVVR
jgi:hypothetical protein